MPSPSHRPGLSSFVAAAAAALTCLVLSAPALAGDPLTSIKVNEVESDGLADFIELTNTSATPTDVSGLILKDNDDSRTLAIPDTTSIPAGGFLAVDTDVPGGFGLGPSDEARVFMPDGLTEIDGITWTVHAPPTLGRCPDGTGAPVITGAVTKGAANSCPPPPAQPWPGSATVTTVDETAVLGGDVSGLAYEGSDTGAPGVLWAVDNGGSVMHRLVFNGTQWVRDTANGWSAGKELRYPTGIGLDTAEPDSEGVTLTDAGAAGGVYVSSERALVTAPGISRISILRYDVSGAGGTLTATNEWDLTPNHPGIGFNLGAESVEWVPDTYLVASGFVDQATGLPYNPATYANHGTGLFFIGLEVDGSVHAYALDHISGSFTRVATFASGFGTFGALHWEPATNQLWVVCDDKCDGRSHIFQVQTQAGATKGSFVRVAGYDRPTGMDNLNNEGFTIAPASECVGGSKPVFWADDGNTGQHVLRAGTIRCSAPAAAGWSASLTVKGDFNGDGFADLAVAAPGENAGGGAVHVLRGSASGLSATSSQLFTQNTTGIADTQEPGDQFGGSLAAGDLTGDGIADLAVGAPGENGGAGAVHVLKGSASGLTVTGSQLWSQDSAGITGDEESGDHFGWSLAIGNYGGSAHPDLAIGAPDEDESALSDSGAVHVLPGAGAGVTATGSQFWTQDSVGISDTAEADDRFGATLAAGRMGNGTQADLAIGATGENVGAGAVHVLYGAASGLVVTGQQFWSQDSAGVTDTREIGDHFGASLAIADFGGSADSDLAIGVPDEDTNARADSGAVHVLPGSATGITATASTYWHQNSIGITDIAEVDDRFGATLAAGNLGNSAQSDLAIGATGENVGAGAVHAIYGTSSGLAATGQQFWSQDSVGITDVRESGDHFASSLAIGNFGGTSHADLAVGVPEEDTPTLSDTGAVNVLPGAASGLTATGSQFWTQNSVGIADTAEAGDRFGGGVGR